MTAAEFPKSTLAPRTGKTRRLSRGVLLAALLSMLLAPSAHALKFANQFCEFELPAKWRCLLEGADWVCQSEDTNKKRDAIIVLAAKIKGDQDSMDKYTAYLNKARVFNSAGGKPVTSQPKYTANKQLNNQVWVDSLHLESEIPGFFTRYLATVYQDIGVLVTYSVNKAKYQEYSKQFEDMVGSLKVFRKAGSLNKGGTDLFAQNSQTTSQIFNPTLSSDTGAPVGPGGTSAVPGGGMGIGLIALIAVAGAAFFIWKKKSGGS